MTIILSARLLPDICSIFEILTNPQALHEQTVTEAQISITATVYKCNKYDFSGIAVRLGGLVVSALDLRSD